MGEFSPLSLGLLLAGLAALGYTFASFFLKSALGRGANAAQVNLCANLGVALVVQPLWWHDDPAIQNAPLILPAITCVTFFAGQVFTFAALAKGDVSVATPLLGTKIILVTALNALIFSLPIPAKWWIAAIAASVATAIIAGGVPRSKARATALTAVLSLTAAAFFSLTDVLVQQWAGNHDPLAYLPAMFGGVGMVSTLFYAITDRSAFVFSKQTLLPLSLGSVLLGVQCALVFLALSWSRDATAVNVAYSLRTLMSVLLAWAFGRWFGLGEASVGARVMWQRTFGAVLLFGAILLILRG
jgi:drug/metabolite transporter (DMT)-like permease